MIYLLLDRGLLLSSQSGPQVCAAMTLYQGRILLAELTHLQEVLRDIEDDASSAQELLNKNKIATASTIEGIQRDANVASELIDTSIKLIQSILEYERSQE